MAKHIIVWGVWAGGGGGGNPDKSHKMRRDV